ncbi:MAG: hypothetical protein HY287_03160 [Planctomycetes bacterium]|nr:hypothetical protein [Planctomycetota bacterium]
MSLKAFHILFIVISSILCAGFGAWAVNEYLHFGDAATLAWGLGSFIFVALLLVYGRWFLKKLSGLNGW